MFIVDILNSFPKKCKMEKESSSSLSFFLLLIPGPNTPPNTASLFSGGLVLGEQNMNRGATKVHFSLKARFIGGNWKPLKNLKYGTKPVQQIFLNEVGSDSVARASFFSQMTHYSAIPHSVDLQQQHNSGWAAPLHTHTVRSSTAEPGELYDYGLSTAKVVSTGWPTESCLST